jgi:hypothetical protein
MNCPRLLFRRNLMENPVEKANKSRRQTGGRAVESKQNEGGAGLTAPRAHLIRIPETEAMQRAIMVLGEVLRPYCGFTDHRLLVTNDHIEALKREGIPFELL